MQCHGLRILRVCSVARPVQGLPDCPAVFPHVLFSQLDILQSKARAELLFYLLNVFTMITNYLNWRKLITRTRGYSSNCETLKIP